MKQIQIGGLVSFTTIDFPGKLAAVLFLVGCPFHCVYCSNEHLIPVAEGEYDPDKIFEWLKSRIGKLEGIVFSGGEALMQNEATIEYMKKVKELGFAIGLHTNGFYPEILKKITDIVDWIGLDFKATKQKYKDLTGMDLAYDRMVESLQYWTSIGKDIEVRTTCDPRFVSKQDLLEIAKITSEFGVKHFAVQKYVPYHEEESCITTDKERKQFFDDAELTKQINGLFESVIWRQ